MSRFGKYTRTLLRLMLFIGLVIVSVISVPSWAFAQTGPAPLWVVRSFSTSEYGVTDPKGLAFSSAANTFLILDGSANVTLVTMGEEHARTGVIPEVQNDPLNTAFDKKSGSLFVFDRGRSELVQIQIDGKGLSARLGANAFGVKDPQGLAFDPMDGRMFILDAGKAQIISIAPHSTLGFNAEEAIRSNNVQRISLKKLGSGLLKGIAYNPGNGHLYVAEPGQKKLYELTQSGDLVSSFDLAALGISNPSAMTFAPSADNTDDPNIYDLFMLDTSTVSTDSQIVELSFQVPAALPPGTTLLPTTLVHVIDTSKAAWSPSAPDPAGLDYWPLTGRLLISDSEVEEMPPYWTGKNVFQSTTSGTLVSTCSTTSFSNEPTGLAINPNNNHIFISDDSGSTDKVFEVSLGADGQYCTADDTVSITDVGSLYGIGDAEDVAYGNNTLFIASGIDAEVFSIPLGANGVLGGGDDGPMTHFDTARLGFNTLEGLGYNSTAGTLFILSPRRNERYLGETTTTGALLRAYNLAYSGLVHPEDVTYAAGSQNSAVKNVYLTDRGVDNDINPLENDGKIWEISLGSSQTTPTRTPTAMATKTITPTFTAPVPVGTYDDTHAAWQYGGAWSVYTGSGPYNNTLHYTGTVGNYAQLVFNGARFTLTYTKHTNRGSIDVFVDGARIITINANSTSLQWQQTYTSPTFSSGTHTVRLVYAGGGTYIDVDAIQIHNAPVGVPAGTYDDTNGSWVYSGAWAVYTGSGPYNNTLHYTDTVGSSAELSFTGTRFKLTYTKHPNRGSIDVFVDGARITTINANSNSLQWQQTYTSPTFSSGTHTVRLVYAGGGTYIDVDAIQIYAPVTYDDTHAAWRYSGTWTPFTGSGPYNNTLHYTDGAGNYAELLFTGTRFTLTFTRHTNRGAIDVYVDGAKLTTINARSSALQWQQTYTSPILASGDHAVRLVHAGGGTYIDVDALSVLP